MCTRFITNASTQNQMQKIYSMFFQFFQGDSHHVGKVNDLTVDSNAFWRCVRCG